MLAAKVDAASVVTKLGGANLSDAIAKVVEQSTQSVGQRAQEKLSGEVLSERSGKLKASIAESASGMCGRVTADAPYARIQEYGGLINVPEIAPNSAKALAFTYEGKLVFAKSARSHSVSIPERSYLRSALAETAQDFADAVRKVVTEQFV